MSRFRSGEATVFTVAAALALVHAIDDAFVHPGPGLGHTDAIHEHPVEYENRVAEFFDRSLL